MKLVGSFSTRLEKWGILSIPDVYLAAMGRELVVGRADGGPHCLEVWSRGEQTVLGGGIAVAADEAGRVALPPGMLDELAGMDVVVCGNGDHLELWEQGAWERFCEETAGDVEGLLGN